MSDAHVGSIPTAFDAIVVGAGPAGSAAALELARAGRSVALVERGPYPGSKNMYGGVVYAGVLDEVIPNWRDEAPVQRWVVRRAMMIMDGDRALTIDYGTPTWGRPPYNGMTTYRADFDAWLADKAVAAGARLIPSTVATGLLRDALGRIVGIHTDRPEGDLRGGVVIACDGSNSFLAKEAGLLPRANAATHTLGVKEVLDLSPDVIGERFGLRAGEGLDVEILGCTKGIPGGGFFYTNRATVSLGVVVRLPELAASKMRPEMLIEDLKTHPAIAPWVRGATLREYSAHLIPEGGYNAMPTLHSDGFLIAGDAGGMCLAAGIWLEGVNFALGSGLAAGRAAAAAIATGDTSKAQLASYRRDIGQSFVLGDHKRYRRASHLVLSKRVQQLYPGLLCDLAEGVFEVTNPKPKPGILRLFLRSRGKRRIGFLGLIRDGLNAARIFR